jgi:hypothetical protein
VPEAVVAEAHEQAEVGHRASGNRSGSC